jgi:hypothetical protein
MWQHFSFALTVTSVDALSPASNANAYILCIGWSGVTCLSSVFFATIVSIASIADN